MRDRNEKAGGPLTQYIVSSFTKLHYTNTDYHHKETTNPPFLPSTKNTAFRPCFSCLDCYLGPSSHPDTKTSPAHLPSPQTKNAAPVAAFFVPEDKEQGHFGLVFCVWVTRARKTRPKWPYSDPDGPRLAFWKHSPPTQRHFGNTGSATTSSKPYLPSHHHRRRSQHHRTNPAPSNDARDAIQCPYDPQWPPAWCFTPPKAQEVQCSRADA